MQDVKPKAAKTIINNAYVDDICNSAVNAYEAKTLTSDVDEVLATGGFQVKKWTSNVVLDSKESSEEVALGGETHAEKVFGTVWLPFPVKLTKRQILSKLAGSFDPIGASAAVLIKPKIAMQQLWQIGLGWDEEVPPNERIKWLALFEEMTALNDVKFDHCLTPPGADGNPSLVVFCNAS